jgi:hypothetical protein
MIISFKKDNFKYAIKQIEPFKLYGETNQERYKEVYRKLSSIETSLNSVDIIKFTNEYEENEKSLHLIQLPLSFPAKVSLSNYSNNKSSISDWYFSNPNSHDKFYNPNNVKFLAMHSLMKLVKDKNHMLGGCEEDVHRENLCPKCLKNSLYHIDKFSPCLECSIRLEKIERKNEIHGSCLNCSKNRVIQAYNWLAIYINTLNLKKIFRDKRLLYNFKEFIIIFIAILLYEMENINRVETFI